MKLSQEQCWRLQSGMKRKVTFSALGKGNKQRTIYLLNSTVKILKHYVLFHPANPLAFDFAFFPI